MTRRSCRDGERRGAPGTCLHCGGPETGHTAQGESRGAWPTHAAPGCPGRNLGTKPGKESHRGAAPTRAIESRRRRLAGEEARGQEPATAATPGKALNGPRDETRTSTLFRNEGKSGSPSGGRWRGRTGRCAGTACLARHAAGGEDGTDSWRFTWHRIALVNYQVYSHGCHSITPEGLHKTARTRPTPGRR